MARVQADPVVEEPGSAGAAAPDTAETPASAPPRKPTRRRRIRRLWTSRDHLIRFGATLVCGFALAAAYPPFGAWWLAPFAVAGLTIIVAGRSAKGGFGYGLAFGLTFFFVLFPWLLVLGVDAWVALSIAEAVFVGVMAAGVALVTRFRLAPLWIACLWVGQEALRDRYPFGGMPWGRLAYSQSHTFATPLVAVGSAPFLTFVVALVGACLGIAVLRWRDGVRPSRTAAIAWLSVAVVAPLFAFLVPVRTGGENPVRFALVQGNVPRLGLDFLGQAESVVHNHVNVTLDYAAKVKAGLEPAPQAVIWPENSTDLDPYKNGDIRAAISGAAQAVGAPILVGAMVDAPDGIHGLNQGIVWDPATGPGATYTKRHLVLFGEYIPYRAFLTKYISELSRTPRDLLPGHTNGILQVGPAKIGDVICFEVADDNLVRGAVTGGGRVIVVQTNNATYGRTAQPAQQLAISQLRAVEHGRSVLIAATSGISAVIDPSGHIESQSRQFTPDVLTATVPMRSSLTLADRVGEWPEWILAAAGGAAFLVGWWTRRRPAGDAEVRPDTTGNDQVSS